jgi:hypothetical protein
LRLFVTSSALRYSSIKQYSEALAHYAATQASRTELIQALCRTALGIGSRPMAPARAKPEAFPQPVVLAKRRRLGRGVAVAAVVLLCLLGAAALLLPSFAVAPTPAARSSIVTPVEASPPEIPEPQPASRPVTEAPGPATATAPARPAVAGASAAVRVPQYVPPPNAPPPAPDPSRETARGGQVASPLQALPVNAGSVATAKPPVAEPPPPARSSREPGAVAGDGPAAFVPPVATSGGARDPRIYTVNDRDVDPPVLLSPGLPTAPGLADRVSNILEVLVDEAGHVQSVKMQSTSRMTDTMVTSAAKYMKFRPASKNGKAVQYRLFMKVSSPPPR